VRLPVCTGRVSPSHVTVPVPWDRHQDLAGRDRELVGGEGSCAGAGERQGCTQQDGHALFDAGAGCS